MRNRFDRQLLELNNELIEMGSLIEKAIEMAIAALVKQDVERAGDAIKFDEEIDHQEKEIEGLCMKLLLQQQPVARDLRLISAALKMISDMERIGDHAGDIAELIKQLPDFVYNKLSDVHQMGTEIQKMLHDSIDAYTNRDVSKAQDVIAHDDVVDELYHNIKKELVRQIQENKGDGEQIADYLLIVKYFERIGDHATNIAEWVIFSITGNLVN